MLTMNKNTMQKVIVLTILTVGIFFAGVYQTNAQTKSVAGEWDASYNTPGGVRTFKIVFKVDGEKLTGTVKRSSGDSQLEGTIKGNDIQFSYAIRYNNNDLTIMMTGKVEGDTIKGVVSFGGNAEEEWNAKRAPEPKPTM